MNLIEMRTNDAVHARVCGWISDNYQGICEYAGRTCYHKEANAAEDTWKRYIHARVKSGHESVIEHNSVAIMFQVDPIMKNVIMQLAAYVAKNNNLLRTIFNYEGNSLIITGNLRSFRDFIKNATDALELDKNIYSLAEVWYYYIYSAFMFLTNDDYIEEKDDEGNDKKTYIFAENLKMKSRQFTWSMVHAEGTDPTPIHTEDLNYVFSGNGMSLGIIGYDTIDNLEDLLIANWGFEPSVQTEYQVESIRNAVMNMGRVSYRVKIPRVISQQDTRHRIGAISQQSQRYVNADNAEFYYPVDPSTMIPDGENTITIQQYYHNTIEAYDEILRMGEKKEAARFLLPGGIMTEYVMTKPFYTLPHYFFERCSTAAQVEIRTIAQALRSFVDENVVGDNNDEYNFHNGR